MSSRTEMLDRLQGHFDVLVVGGGVTGCGIARDAARRGLSVALVEMEDLASGTSSRSSKLVHGGLRYLEQYEFSLVFEAVSERRILQDIAPHLVNPLPFLFPVYKESRRKLWLIQAGMWLYDGLSLFRSPKLHRKLSAAEVGEIEPALIRTKLAGAPLYYDCSTNDARLTLETGLDGANAGAAIATWCRVKSFIKSAEGRVQGAVVEDTLSGTLREVHASVVVNATGPWTDRTIAMSKPLATGGLLRPTKGVHIVVDAEKLPVRHAVVCFHPVDDRVLFAIPWGDRTYIGTTDTDFEGDPANCLADADDVSYLIDACAAYFPDHLLTSEDVISTWAGLRPLMAPIGKDGDVQESSVSREHQIVVGQDGLITIAGGKLTTYRLMAAEVVETAVKMLRLSNALPELVQPSRTDREPLPGAIGWPSDDDHAKVASQVVEAGKGSVDEQTAAYLANEYGMCGVDIAQLAHQTPALAERLIPGRPEILAQVDWAVTHELAATVTDFMRRRTQVYYRDLDQGLSCAAVVAARMGQLLDWDEATEKARLQHYLDEVADSRRWRHQEPSSPNSGNTGSP